MSGFYSIPCFAVSLFLGGALLLRACKSLTRCRELALFKLGIICTIFMALHDLAITPIAFLLVDKTEYLRKPWIDVTPDMLSGGWFMTLVTYAMLWAGLQFAYLLRSRSIRVALCTGVSNEVNLTTDFRASRKSYKAGLILWCFGIICNATIIMMLLREGGFLEIASDRLLFASEVSTQSALFANLSGYFRLLPQYGFLVMAISQDRVESRRISNKLFFVTTIVVMSIYGGRYSVLTFTCAYVVVLLTIYGRLAILGLKKNWVFYSLLLITPLVFVSVLRFNKHPGGLKARLELTLESLLIRELRVHQTAWVTDFYPDYLSFMGANGLLVPLKDALPGIAVPAQTLIHVMREAFFENIMTGRGMYSFTNATEFYSWFGMPAVVLVPLIYGILYGLIFLWPCIRRQNSYVFIYSLIVLSNHFFGALPGRMPEGLGRIVFPLVFIAGARVLANDTKYREVFMLNALAFCVFLLSYRIANAEMLKYLAVICISLMYIVSFFIINEKMVRISCAPCSGETPRQEIV